MPADRSANTVCTCSRCSLHTYKDEDGVEHPGQLRRPAAKVRHEQLDQYKGDTARFNLVSATLDPELDVDQRGSDDLPVLHRDYAGPLPVVHPSPTVSADWHRCHAPNTLTC